MKGGGWEHEHKRITVPGIHYMDMQDRRRARQVDECRWKHALLMKNVEMQHTIMMYNVFPRFIKNKFLVPLDAIKYQYL